MSDTITLPGLPQVAPEERVRRQPPYHVILLDDDDHTYEYVIGMLQQLFGYPHEKGYQMALEVHTTGRVIVLTTTKEHGELKRDLWGASVTVSQGAGVFYGFFGRAGKGKGSVPDGTRLASASQDGTVQVNHGGTEMGQGLHTKIQQIAAESLGLPLAAAC